jgi:hypothetical protein
MEISSILIGFVLLLASLAFVSLPFRQKQRASLKTHKATEHHEGQRESVLYALRDLDFDFKTGKVGEEDYTSLRAQLMTEAAKYIEQDKEEEEKLEALIQTRRTAQHMAANCDHCGAAVNKELCPSCGKKNQAGDQFCSSCGNRLEVKLEAVGQ